MRASIGCLAGPGLDVRDVVQHQNMDKAFFERTESADVPPAKVLFGPFLLLEGDKPVPLGSRALEILIALVGRRGELVSKQDLTARVWPNLLVEPSNLTVHMSALRRALRDGQDGNRFIINIPRRGYCFVAPVAVSGRIEPDGDENRAAGGSASIGNIDDFFRN